MPVPYKTELQLKYAALEKRVEALEKMVGPSVVDISPPGTKIATAVVTQQWEPKPLTQHQDYTR